MSRTSELPLLMVKVVPEGMVVVTAVLVPAKLPPVQENEPFSVTFPLPPSAPLLNVVVVLIEEMLFRLSVPPDTVIEDVETCGVTFSVPALTSNGWVKVGVGL